jgi:hypothetical protein
LPVSKGRNTLLRASMLQCKVGDVIFLPNEDWKTKNTPYYVVGRVKKTHGFLFEWGKSIDQSGWWFSRVK